MGMIRSEVQRAQRSVVRVGLWHANLDLNLRGTAFQGMWEAPVRCSPKWCQYKLVFLLVPHI